MNDLCKSELIRLLSEPSETVTNIEMQNAYESFIRKIITLNNSENNYHEVYRMLNITRVELIGLELLYQYEQGEKCA